MTKRKINEDHGINNNKQKVDNLGSGFLFCINIVNTAIAYTIQNANTMTQFVFASLTLTVKIF